MSAAALRVTLPTISLAGDRFAQPRRMLTAQETSLNPGEVTSNLDELGHVVSVAASKLV